MIKLITSTNSIIHWIRIIWSVSFEQYFNTSITRLGHSFILKSRMAAGSHYYSLYTIFSDVESFKSIKIYNMTSTANIANTAIYDKMTYEET